MEVKDLLGNEEMLTGFKGLNRERSVNGEKLLSFTLFSCDSNVHSFPMVNEESQITFKDEYYIVKKINRKPVANTYYKEVMCIHKFYCDFIDQYIYSLHTRSFTFFDILELIFTNSGYTYEIVGTFNAEAFENFGDENKLSLFQTVLNRYGAEFEIINNTKIRLSRKIGDKTDFQFRYGYNIKALDEQIDTRNLSTYIEGYGAEGITTTYESPNSTVFGKRHAKSVRDERFTSVQTLTDHLTEVLQDEPLVSITLDFVDMRKAGYPFDVPSEGNEVYLIYEPMNIDLTVRLVKINEVFDEKENVLSTSITLGNLRKSMAQVVANLGDVSKRFKDIVDQNGKIRFSVLDEAVQTATNALTSAQTELEFENGIIARSKVDPNHIVFLNSKGLGISKNNGQTFTEAITSEGFVLSAGAIGTLAADHIIVGDGRPIDDFALAEAQDGKDAKSLTDVWKYPNTVYINGGQIYANSVGANQIKTSELIVGDNITMGPNAVIQWNNVKSKPTIPSTASDVGALPAGTTADQIGGITVNNPRFTYIDQNGVYTHTVQAAQIIGDLFRVGNGATTTKLEFYTRDNDSHHIISNQAAGFRIESSGSLSLKASDINGIIAKTIFKAEKGVAVASTGTFQSDGNSVFNARADFYADVNFRSGGSFACSKPAVFYNGIEIGASSRLTVYGASDFYGTTTIASGYQLNVNGNAYFSNTVQLAGGANVYGSIGSTGSISADESMNAGNGAFGYFRHRSNTGTYMRLGDDGFTYYINGVYKNRNSSIPKNRLDPDVDENGKYVVNEKSFIASSVASMQPALQDFIKFEANGKTKVYLNEKFKNFINWYEVFARGGEVLEINQDHFIIDGNGPVTCLIIGVENRKEGIRGYEIGYEVLDVNGSLEEVEGWSQSKEQTDIAVYEQPVLEQIL